jgi:competence protein ComEA
VGGDRTYLTTLLIALAVLCLAVVAARWVVLARRVPLSPLPASITAPANRDADNTAEPGGDAAGKQPETAGSELSPTTETGAASNAGQNTASAASAGGRAASAESKPAKLPTASSKLELNSATAAQLDLLPGIGPTLAKRIVDYRKQNGPFKRVDDLLNVSGIGEHKLAEIQELVYVKPAQ